MSEISVRPDVRRLLDALSDTPLAHLGALGVGETRALLEQIRSKQPAPLNQLSIVRDLDCEGPDGRIELRFYDARAERPGGPILVYYHGGGFTLVGTRARVTAATLV